MSVPVSGNMIISNAGTKLRIPVSRKEILLSKEEMEGVLPKYRAILIKTAIKLWIQYRINVERVIENHKLKAIEMEREKWDRILEGGLNK